MSGLPVLLVSLLLGAAVLLWPGRARVTASSARGAARGGAAGRAGPVRAALRSVWHEDPVELVRAWRLRHRPESLVDVVLDLLDGIRPALDAGLPPARAVEIAGACSLGRDLARGAGRPSTTSGRTRRREIELLVEALVEAAEAGTPMSSTWAESARRSGSAELAFIASAWRLSETTGAPLAAAVGRAADGLRDARTRRGKLAVAVAGPKATVTVLTALPLTGPLFGWVCGVGPVAMYLGSGLSLISLLLGLALIVLGRFWCSRIIRAAVAA
ncbi:hypothetical protein GCM10027053_27080 [Intrasporangium mesophilum]